VQQTWKYYWGDVVLTQSCLANLLMHVTCNCVGTVPGLKLAPMLEVHVLTVSNMYRFMPFIRMFAACLALQLGTHSDIRRF